MQLNPYLNFNGQCEAAFKFYEECLRGKIVTMLKYGETPMAKDVSPEWREKIVHVSMEIDGQMALMGADAPQEHYREPQGLSITLGIKDLKEAERIFRALEEGGKVTLPFQKTFWTAGFGMLVDRFGIPWMVNCEQSVSQ
jgi:PhnB protein